MRRHSRVHSQRRSLVQIVVAAFGICIETAGFFSRRAFYQGSPRILEQVYIDSGLLTERFHYGNLNVESAADIRKAIQRSASP